MVKQERENSCSGEKALMCFLGLVSGAAARGGKKNMVSMVSHMFG